MLTHFKLGMFAAILAITYYPCTQAQQPQQQLLEPDDAFKFKVTADGPNKLVVDLTPAKGYYLYKDKIRMSVKPSRIIATHFPAGDMKNDLNFGKTEVYHKAAKITVDLDKGSPSKKITINATYQGCNEPVGVCYPPIQKSVDLIMP